MCKNFKIYKHFTIDISTMVIDCVQTGSIPCVPDFDGVIPAARYQQIRYFCIPQQSPHWCCMPTKNIYTSILSVIPYSNSTAGKKWNILSLTLQMPFVRRRSIINHMGWKATGPNFTQLWPSAKAAQTHSWNSWDPRDFQLISGHLFYLHLWNKSLRFNTHIIACSSFHIPGHHFPPWPFTSGRLCCDQDTCI